MVILLVTAGIGFTGIPQQFFPDSTRAQFMIDYWAPQGTTMRSVSADLRGIEEKLNGDPRVVSTGTFMGAGGPRFYLPVDPEFPYSSYGPRAPPDNGRFRPGETSRGPSFFSSWPPFLAALLTAGWRGHRWPRRSGP